VRVGAWRILLATSSHSFLTPRFLSHMVSYDAPSEVCLADVACHVIQLLLIPRVVS